MLKRVFEKLKADIKSLDEVAKAKAKTAKRALSESESEPSSSSESKYFSESGSDLSPAERL